MKTYWLERKRAAMAMAREAKTGETRLIHYEMAGRYSIKAATSAPPPTDAAPPAAEAEAEALPDAVHYAQLEIGARYLADGSSDPTQREVHLQMARIYRRRACDASAYARTLN